jgi:hypothetical protein
LVLGCGGGVVCGLVVPLLFVLPPFELLGDADVPVPDEPDVLVPEVLLPDEPLLSVADRSDELDFCALPWSRQPMRPPASVRAAAVTRTFGRDVFMT